MDDPMQNPIQVSRTGYHAKIGGDLDGRTFHDIPTYFAGSAHEAEMYAEHIAYNEGYEEDFQDAGITIFKVHLEFRNAILLDRATLSVICGKLGITQPERERYIDKFEDSEQDERERVFAWVQAQGYDGAILPNDLMPIYAGGDWHMQESLVALNPEKQVSFAYSCHD